MVLHVISDIFLSFHEKAVDQHYIDAKTTHIVLTGDISIENKRSMLYAETLSKLYPNMDIIYNYGIAELIGKRIKAARDGFSVKFDYYKNLGSRLFHPKGQVINGYDFYCTIGWPQYQNLDDFASSRLNKGTVQDYTEEFYIENVKMTNKMARAWTYEFVEHEAKKELEDVMTWYETDLGAKKILVTAYGPYSFSEFLLKANYKVLNNLALSNLLWIHGGSKQISNNHYLCSSGRNRSHYVRLEQ
jgi:hypothetical protein